MDGVTRAELEATYAHPYVRWLPLGYRLSHVDLLVGGTALAWAVVALLDATGSDAADGVAVLGWLLLVVTVVWTAFVTGASVLAIRQRTREWRAGPHRSSNGCGAGGRIAATRTPSSATTSSPSPSSPATGC